MMITIGQKQRSCYTVLRPAYTHARHLRRNSLKSLLAQKMCCSLVAGKLQQTCTPIMSNLRFSIRSAVLETIKIIFYIKLSPNF